MECASSGKSVGGRIWVSRFTGFVFCLMATGLLNPTLMFGQVSLKGGNAASKPIDPIDRSLAALELSRAAAESGLKDVSLEAVRRAMGNGPPVSSVELGGLLGNSPNRQMSSSQLTQQSNLKQTQVVNQLIQIAKVWKEKSFDSAECYFVLKQIVFPASRPSEAFCYSNQMRSNSRSFGNLTLEMKTEPAPILSVAETLVHAARDASMVDDLRLELANREEMPSAKLTVRLIQLLLAIDEPAENQEALCRELAQSPALIVKDQDASLLFSHVNRLLKTLPEDSAARKELWEAVAREAEADQTLSPDSWLGYAIRVAAIESLKSGDQPSFDRYTLVLFNTLKPLRRGNESYVAGLESSYYGSASTIAFDAGHTDLGVKFLGLSLSQGALSRNSSAVSLAPRAPLIKQLLKLEPQSRFTILDSLVWSMPKLGLQQAAMVNVRDNIPQRFSDAWKAESGATQFPFEKLTSADAFSTSLLEILMRDAQAIGKIDEVKQRIADLESRKSEDAILAKILLSRVQTGSIDLSLAKAADDEPRLLHSKGQKLLGLPLEVDIARAALADPATREMGMHLASEFHQTKELRETTAGRHAIHFATEAAQHKDGKPETPDSLKHFVLASDMSRTSMLAGDPQNALWFEKSPVIWEHKTGISRSCLLIKYPLQGDYEITVRCNLPVQNYGPGIAINNICLDVAKPYGRFQVRSSSGRNHQWVMKEKLPEGEFVTFVIRREKADSVKITLDGEPAVELLVADNEFPFFGFASARDSANSFELVGISGNYSIPRNQELLTPSLLGWSAMFDGSILPDVKYLAPDVEVQPSSPVDSVPVENKADVNEDWRMVEGVLESVDHAALQKIDLANKLAVNEEKLKRREAWLYYTRPLCDGEQFDFEYWHEPGKFSVWPTIDRIAIGIEPDQVFEHWITSDSGDWFGVNAENRLKLESANRDGKVDLKSGDWNKITLRRSGDIISVSINGVSIHEQKVDAVLQGRFGFFHAPNDFQVRVRSASLTGNWPEKLPENLFEKRSRE
ncbi:MAG: DUF1583 domain-containing protein [Pirellulaceae bacterium]